VPIVPRTSDPPYVYVWEFLVAPGREQEFLAAYGADGKWARLFRQADGYIETLLLRDRTVAERYLTIDRWSSEDAHAAFLQRFRSQYEALDRECEDLMRYEASLGSYWDLR
jgi:heme-degrading monooxygenase HmoA